MNQIYIPAILLICIMIMIFILMCIQLNFSKHIGEARREMASLALKLAGLNKKYNDLYHQFNRHIHNDVHDIEPLRIQIKDET